MNSHKFLLLFKSTHLTLKAEKLFKKNNIIFRTTLKPKSITSDCGIAIVIEEDNLNKAISILKAKKIKDFQIYKQVNNDWISYQLTQN